jgi:serine/threonine-protein kinase HipA
MRRAERRRAEREGQTPRSLREIDYLLMVDDDARMGALRFGEREGGPFLAEYGSTRIPPLIELPRLLSAADHATSNTDTFRGFASIAGTGIVAGRCPPESLRS